MLPKRNAYLYVHQSTLRQVLETPEITKLPAPHFARALVMYWPSPRLVPVTIATRPPKSNNSLPIVG
jgi:hypothetical protein